VPGEHRPPLEHANGTNTDGGANVGNGVKRGATEILDTNAAGRRGRPLVELSREAWEKAKAAIAWGSFFWMKMQHEKNSWHTDICFTSSLAYILVTLTFSIALALVWKGLNQKM
jgi:hypothetical protein